MATESDGVRRRLLDGRLGGVLLESASGDDFAFEDRPPMFGGDSAPTFANDLTASDPWFNDVEVGEPERIQAFGDIGEERRRIAVRHAVPGPAGADPDGDAIASPYRNER
jgi:hypothetical protein